MAIYTFEPVDLAIFATLILLEGVLSFDNAAIIAALARRLPAHQRHKALMYGLVGAYVFRVAAIIGVAYILGNPLLQLIAGGYLVFLAGKHFVQLRRHAGHGLPEPRQLLGLSAFWSTVVTIELADIAFALDQIVVAVAFTDKIPIIIAAALIAIVFLRIAAYYLSRIMDWFPGLEHIAYLVVGLVGVKIWAEHFLHFHTPEYISAPLTLGIFIIPTLVKYIADRVRGDAPLDEPEA